MSDIYVQLVSIQPSQSTKANNQQAPSGKSIPHGNSTVKGGLYSDRRKKTCTTGR
jgi:hypothetical protein